MRIILNTYSNEHWDGECSYALIDLSPTDADRILTRMVQCRALQEHDPSLAYLSYWDYSPVYFGHSEAPESLEGINPDTLLEAPEDFSPKGESVEVSLMKVDADSVSWTGLVKHTDIEVTTAEISKEELKKIMD